MTLCIMFKQGRSMPTHGRSMVDTTEFGDRFNPTVSSEKTLHSSTKSLRDTQTTHNQQPTAFYNTIKSTIEDFVTPSKSEVELDNNLKSISTVEHISGNENIVDDKKRYAKERSILPTLQSDVKDTTPIQTHDESFTKHDIKQSSSNEYRHGEPKETSNGNEFVTKQYTTEITNGVTTLKDVTRSTTSKTSNLETTENADFMISGTLLNSDEKGDLDLSENKATSEQKSRKSTTRASRSLRNLVIPNIIGLLENESLEILQPTRTLLDATTRPNESYTLDENWLNNAILMATNLEWCSSFTYYSLYQTNNTTITEFASLSTNQIISQSSIDGLRLCDITLIKASLRMVNNTLYSYEPLLHQYIGGGQSQVITFYNSLRKYVQKLVNPSSKGPVMIQNSESYVHDTSRTLETLATLNRLAGQIGNVLQEIRHCQATPKNSA